MTAWICVTCGVQYPDTEQPPSGCPICSDERQYVGWDGQQWTSMPELAQNHANELREEEPALIGSYDGEDPFRDSLTASGHMVFNYLTAKR